MKISKLYQCPSSGLEEGLESPDSEAAADDEEAEEADEEEAEADEEEAEADEEEAEADEEELHKKRCATLPYRARKQASCHSSFTVNSNWVHFTTLTVRPSSFRSVLLALYILPKASMKSS